MSKDQLKGLVPKFKKFYSQNIRKVVNKINIDNFVEAAKEFGVGLDIFVSCSKEVSLMSVHFFYGIVEVLVQVYYLLILIYFFNIRRLLFCINRSLKISKNYAWIQDSWKGLQRNYYFVREEIFKQWFYPTICMFAWYNLEELLLYQILGAHLLCMVVYLLIRFILSYSGWSVDQISARLSGWSRLQEVWSQGWRMVSWRLR